MESLFKREADFIIEMSQQFEAIAVAIDLRKFMKSDDNE